MHFDNPHILWLLLAWPLLGWLGWATLAWRRRVAARIGQAHTLGRLYPASVSRWRRRQMVLMILAIGLLIVAAARPQYGRIEQALHSYGTNVIIALDCSASMGAADVAPNRMTAAKRSLEQLIHRLGGNRIGIVAFAGVAFLQCPMTLDHAMALMMLDSLGTDSVGVAGTDLGAAIDQAAQAFERGAGEGSRVLVLLTDGEDNEGRGLEAARRAAEKQIRIYAIGIGTARGAPLPDAKGGFKEDASGAKVNTQLRLETLEAIARATGGLAIAAGADSAAASPGAATELIASLIGSQQKEQLESRRHVIYQDRFQWFLAPALLLLLWMLVLTPEPTRTGQA